MSKKNKDFIKYRSLPIKKEDDTSHILNNLESAWNNMPDDLCQDERMFFIELVEKVAKMHHSLKKSPSDDLSKN